jgi:hypothetical protein
VSFPACVVQQLWSYLVAAAKKKKKKRGFVFASAIFRLPSTLTSLSPLCAFVVSSPERESARVCFQRQVAVAGTETAGDLRGTMSDDDHHFESKADAGASKTFPQQAGTIRKNAYLVIKTRPCKVCFPPPNLVHSACMTS